MRRIFMLLAIVSIALSISPPGLLIAAPGDISVVSSSHVNKFPNEIVFRLEARSSTEIKKVTLYYTVGGAAAVSYAYPTVTPGTSISTQYSLNTQKTYIPPSSEVKYQWLIEDASGNSLRTEFTAFDYDDVRFKWEKLTRDGVTVYWYKGSRTFADGLLDAASAAIKRLSSGIGITYERPVKIVVYDTKSEMDSALPRKSETYQRETITLGVRLSADVLLLLGNQRDLKETLAHELSHMVVHQMVDNPYGDIPAWLDEGLAMVAEEQVPSGFLQGLQDGIRRDALLSVRSMTSYSGDPGKVNLFYGESYSVVKYLIDTYGRDKMVALLKVFKEGATADDALRRTYGFTTDELDAKWRTSLGLSPRPAQDSVSQPNATPIPTRVPLGMPQSRFGGGVIWTFLALAVCLVVLLIGGAASLVVLTRRR